MPQPRRKLLLSLLIDANRINARGKLEYMNHLERWHKDGVISILMPKPAFDQAVAGGKGKKDRFDKAAQYAFTLPDSQSAKDSATLVTIRAILAAGARPTADDVDACILLHAKKYHSVLVTADGASRNQPEGILGRRNELAKIGITVLADWEAVGLVKSRIAERDDYARQWAGRHNELVPSWVGLD